MVFEFKDIFFASFAAPFPSSESCVYVRVGQHLIPYYRLNAPQPQAERLSSAWKRPKLLRLLFARLEVMYSSLYAQE